MDMLYIIEFDNIKSLCTKNDPERSERRRRDQPIDGLSILNCILILVLIVLYIKEICFTVNNAVHL